MQCRAVGVPGHDRAQRVIAEVGRTTSAAVRVLPLQRGGLLLLEARPDFLRALTERPELIYLSAQDVDLAP